MLDAKSLHPGGSADLLLLRRSREDDYDRDIYSRVDMYR